MTRDSLKLQAEFAGAVVAALMARGIDVVIDGPWSIPAYCDDRPSEQTDEYREWESKYPPDGPLDLDLECPFGDRTLSEEVLLQEGFTLSIELTSRWSNDLVFKNERGDIIRLDFFRPARDGGRIFPRLGINDEGWYYPPQTVAPGILGSVRVRATAPTGLDQARSATPEDER